MNSDSEEHKKRISIELPEEHEEQIKEKVEKDYDINSVLERARGKRETDYEIERHRKLNSNGYDILKSIQIKEESDEDKTEPIDELNTQEKTIVELIQNIQNSKPQEKSTKDDTEDLFGELMGKNENTIVMAPIDNEEKNNENIKEALLNITEDLETIKESLNDKTVPDTVDGQKINDRHTKPHRHHKPHQIPPFCAVALPQQIRTKRQNKNHRNGKQAHFPDCLKNFLHFYAPPVFERMNAASSSKSSSVMEWLSYRLATSFVTE